MADRAALLIAVETFFEAGPPVHYAAADCAELLRALPAAGYNPEKCFLVAGTRTTKAAIESHLKRLPKLVDKADSLLVLVVTRGFTHRGRGHLVCADTIAPDLTETSIAVADLMAAIHKTKCKEVAVLLDVDPLPQVGEMMPSGLHEGELKALFDDSAACVGLLASAPGERSYESGQLRHGIWRHHLIEAFTGKIRNGVAKDGALSAAALHAFLEDAVPRTLRRTYETPQEQTPVLFGERNAAVVVAELSGTSDSGGDLLDPGRMKRVVFRAESIGKIKELAGFRKSHSLPERTTGREFVNRIAPPTSRPISTVSSTWSAAVWLQARSRRFGRTRRPRVHSHASFSTGIARSQSDDRGVIWRARSAGCRDRVREVGGFKAVFGRCSTAWCSNSMCR